MTEAPDPPWGPGTVFVDQSGVEWTIREVERTYVVWVGEGDPLDPDSDAEEGRWPEATLVQQLDQGQLEVPEPTLECPHCDFKTESQMGLNSHMRVHQDDGEDENTEE